MIYCSKPYHAKIEGQCSCLANLVCTDSKIPPYALTFVDSIQPEMSEETLAWEFPSGLSMCSGERQTIRWFSHRYLN